MAGSLSAIRRGYPDAQITLLSDERAAPAFENTSVADRLVISRLYAGRAIPSVTKLVEFIRLVLAIGFRYDIVVVLGWATTLLDLLAALTGRRRYGYANRLPILLSVRLGKWDGSKEAAPQNARLLELAGIPAAVGGTPRLRTETDVRSAARLLAESGHDPTRAYAVLHPGSDWACQQWQIERWARLADRIVARHRTAVIFTGSTQEVAYIGRIQAIMAESSISLAGRTTLGVLEATLAGARFAIVVDSVAHELSQSARVPVVVLAGPSLASAPSGGAPRTVVNKTSGRLRQDINHCREPRYIAGGCLDYGCPMAGLRDISVDDVERVLARGDFLGAGDASEFSAAVV